MWALLGLLSSVVFIPVMENVSSNSSVVDLVSALASKRRNKIYPSIKAVSLMELMHFHEECHVDPCAFEVVA